MIELLAVGFVGGHQPSRPKIASPSDSSSGQRSHAGGIQQQRTALVVVALAGRPQPLIGKRRGAVNHRAQPLPGGRVQRAVAPLGLEGRQKPEFGDEALIIRGKLTADARRKGVPGQFVLQEAGGLPPPARAFGEPVKGTAGYKLSRRLGDDVVVGRRAPAPERGQVLLVPADLLHREFVALEEAGGARPPVQKAADPGQADQPDADLDAARPVDARQERVIPPPGAQLLVHAAGVGIIVAEEPGRGQEREVLQPGDLPDLLDVPGQLLHAVVDAERVAAGGGAAAGHRVVEPVGRYQVGPGHAQHLPLAPHKLVRGRQNGRPGVSRYPRGDAGRKCAGEPALTRRWRRQSANLLRSYLPA